MDTDSPYQSVINHIRRRYELGIAAALLGSSRLISPAYAKSAERFLIGVGATIGLVLSNVSSLSETFTYGALRTAIGLFGISILFGLLSLVRARSAEVAHTIVDETTPAVAKQLELFDAELRGAASEHGFSLNEYDTSPPSVGAVMRELSDAAPFWARRQIRRGAKRGAKDSILGLKMAARSLSIQKTYFAFQIASAAAALPVLMLGMHG